jgi:hypothetical protein
MATIKQKIKAERAARALLDAGGLPQPDHVEYGYECVRLLWLEQKLMVVVDIEPDAGDA